MERKKKETSLMHKVKKENEELKKQLEDLKKSKTRELQRKNGEIDALKRQIKELKEEKQNLEAFQNWLGPVHGDEVDPISRLITNPGFVGIATIIFKYLGPKEIAKCRKVSKVWKTFIDSDKTMLKWQLNQVRSRCRPEHQDPFLRDYIRVIQFIPRNRLSASINPYKYLKETMSAMLE